VSSPSESSPAAAPTCYHRILYKITLPTGEAYSCDKCGVYFTVPDELVIKVIEYGG
jgi:hypothetical protein